MQRSGRARAGAQTSSSGGLAALVGLALFEFGSEFGLSRLPWGPRMELMRLPTLFVVDAAMLRELSVPSNESRRLSMLLILSWCRWLELTARSMFVESRAKAPELPCAVSARASSFLCTKPSNSSLRPWASTQARWALLASCMTVSTSMDLLCPCSRRQPLRNSWNAISPVCSMSRRLNRYSASCGCTLMDFHSAATAGSFKRCFI
mmetsp:Transcript_58748/g.182200  ORF Transcript_58748/g.182200 Transcript_58748/m.182200 type:complete len:206 (-) Transcript_58748:238-855(-)